MMKRLILVTLVIVLLIVGFFSRGKPTLPVPKSASDFVNAVKNPALDPTLAEAPQPVPASKPATFNLNIPFQSQAPFGDWSMPYQEACEEAAAIIADRYFSGRPLDAATMKDEILKLIDWENNNFGDYRDETAEQIATVLRDYMGHRDVQVVYNFTIDDIKREISQGHPVIVPAAGRLLGNPNFRRPGPIYHALVIKGYTRDKIITNDPGTRNGKDFLYDPQVLMNAIHDWNPANILDGRKAMIVVKS